MREHLLYKKTGSTVVIQLHRPEKKNSLNSNLRREMQELLEEMAKDTTTRAVILTGGEEIFCAGAARTNRAQRGGQTEGAQGERRSALRALIYASLNIQEGR